MIAGLAAAVITTPPPGDDGGWLDWLDPTDWASKAGTGILTQIAGGVGEAAADLLSGIWGAISESTTPQVDAPFLREWYGRVFAISLPITVGFMALQVILTVVRSRGPAGLGRAVGGAAMAMLGTFAAVPVVALLVRAVDGVAMDLAGVTSGGIETLTAQVTYLLIGEPAPNALLMIGGGIVGVVGSIMLGVLAVVGAIAVWMALLTRAMLLYVVVVIAPICFAGMAWAPTRGWFRRWLTMIVALIFTKLGVVLVFGVGVAAVSSAGLGDGAWVQLGQLFSGLVMLAMAALVPIACFKFFSFLGDESVQALHSGAAAGPPRAGSAVRSAASRPMQALRRRAGSAGSGGGSGGSLGGQQSEGSSAGGMGKPSTGGASPAGGSSPAGGAGAGGAGAAGGAGVGAAGGAAAGAGAVVGAGVVAGKKAADAGRTAAGHADAHREQADSGTGGATPPSAGGAAASPSRGSTDRQLPSRTPQPGGGSSPSPAGGGGPRPASSGGGAAAAASTAVKVKP